MASRPLCSLLLSILLILCAVPTGEVVLFPENLSRIDSSTGDSEQRSTTKEMGRIARNTASITLEEIRKAIIEKGAKWIADSTSVSHLTLQQKKRLCGALPMEPASKETEEKATIKRAVPPNFDWRNCNGYNWMTSIKRQTCDNCWAYASIGVLEPMIRIFLSEPSIPIDLSEMFLTWCYKGACEQWSLAYVLDSLKTKGVPDENCFPETTVDSDCSDACTDCNSRSVFVDSWDLYVEPSINTIKNEIYHNGPVAVKMAIYGDFYYYSGGVYEHITGEYLGDHYVIICGWDDISECWICKNSWGTQWGEGGWFHIKYGECSIETFVYYMRIASATALFKWYGPCNIPVGFNFGDICVGSHGDRSFSIINDTDSMLTIDSITCVNPVFRMLAPVFPQTILWNDSVNVLLRFMPADVISYKGVLMIFISDSTQHVYLKGMSTSAMAQTLSNENVYAYPNPFNPENDEAKITFAITKSANVTIKIFDIRNDLVKTLTENSPIQAKAMQSIAWDGKNESGYTVCNGVYFFLINTDKGEKAIGKVAVLRE